MPRNSIPLVDLRGKTLVDLLRAYPDKAHDLIDSACKTYGLASSLGSRLALPITDKKSRAWLERAQNPYRHEIESMAEILESRGVYTFNVCYEWGCTSGVWRTNDTIAMLRVLDWPFPGLGKHVMVVLQQARAGEFYNITWPGMSGMFAGMAPGRFSATFNQAPMRRACVRPSSLRLRCVLHRSRRKPSGSPTPGTVCAWRISTAQPPARSAAAASAG